MVARNCSLLEDMLQVFQGCRDLVLVVVDDSVAEVVAHILEGRNVGLHPSVEVNAKMVLIDLVLFHRLAFHLQVCKQFNFGPCLFIDGGSPHLLDLGTSISVSAFGRVKVLVRVRQTNLGLLDRA